MTPPAEAGKRRFADGKGALVSGGFAKRGLAADGESGSGPGHLPRQEAGPASFPLDAPPPPLPAVEAELEAFAQTLTPERFSGAIRLTQEGIYLLEGAVFLPYQDGREYWERWEWQWIWSLGFSQEVLDTLERLLPQPRSRWFRNRHPVRHPAYGLLDLYSDYLVLTHTPRDPVAWAWLLVLDFSRVRRF